MHITCPSLFIRKLVIYVLLKITFFRDDVIDSTASWLSEFIHLDFWPELSSWRARGIIVGWDTMIQTGKPRIRFPMWSLHFSIDVIFPAALWPWDRLSLLQKWVPGIFLGLKGGRRVRLTSPPSMSRLSGK
jgi:hypothetical protein